ncbi:MAG: arginine--tRNA ligase [Anaerolineales bacterium]|nr:arginine--tRNA ligase [Anaerolineales bacterium]
MFDLEQKIIEEKIKTFCAANAIPLAELKWVPIPFSGEWGISTSFFATAAAEAKAGKNQGMPVALRAQAIAAAVLDALGLAAAARDQGLPGISRGEALKGYLNLYFSTAAYARRVVDTVLAEAERFGAGHPKNERVMVEYAQPNTHHSFHIGHYRNTILGESLARIVQFAGFETIRASYPGDLGLGVITVLWAYKKFYRGQEPSDVHERGQWLLKIYIEATRLLTEKENETPEEKAQRETYDAERREMYRQWDSGDPAVRQLWHETREWSMDEFRDILRMMDVEIDVWFFESEVDQPSKKVVEELLARGIAQDERPAGPVLVHIDEQLGLTKEKFRTAVVLRSDGTSLYLTKDLALAQEKFEKYQVDRAVYVVDNRQSLHFQQAFAILKLMGFEQAEKCHHLAYGFVSLPEGAMSARRGRVALFKEVYDEAVQRVLAAIAEKNPGMPASEREGVAQKIGMGALAYSMLSVDNNKDMIFDIDEALSFDGRTGPYIQNALVRANSILRKSKTDPQKSEMLEEAAFDYPLTVHEIELIEQMSRLADVVQQAAREYRPLLVAAYVYDLAAAFHSFYHAVPVLQAAEESVRAARLRLVAAARQSLTNGLRLLAIRAPEVM